MTVVQKQPKLNKTQNDLLLQMLDGGELHAITILDGAKKYYAVKRNNEAYDILGVHIEQLLRLKFIEQSYKELSTKHVYHYEFTLTDKGKEYICWLQQTHNPNKVNNQQAQEQAFYGLAENGLSFYRLNDKGLVFSKADRPHLIFNKEDLEFWIGDTLASYPNLEGFFEVVKPVLVSWL